MSDTARDTADDGTLRHWWDLLVVLTRKEFVVRYKGTLLGYLWSVLHPLAYTLVFYVVFGLIMRFESKDHPYWLIIMTGMFPWQWFQNSAVNSANNFLLNRTLIKKVIFPRWVLIVSVTVNDMGHFLVSIPIIWLLMLLNGITPSASLAVWIVPLLIAQFALTLGIGLFVATCNLFLRDLERIVMLGTMLLLYMTPIIFPLDMVPEHFMGLIYANPMAGLIVGWRSAILGDPVPIALVLTAMAGAGVCLAIGVATYRKLQWRFAEVV